MVDVFRGDYLNSFYDIIPALETLRHTDTLNAYPAFLYATTWTDAEWLILESARRSVKINIPVYELANSNPFHVPFVVLQEPRSKRWVYYDRLFLGLKHRMEKRRLLIEKAMTDLEGLMKTPVTIKKLRFTSANETVLNGITFNLFLALNAIEEMKVFTKIRSNMALITVAEKIAFLQSKGRRLLYPLLYHPASDVAIFEVLDEKLRDTGRGAVIRFDEKRLIAEVKLSPIIQSTSMHWIGKSIDPLQLEWFRMRANVNGERARCFLMGDNPKVSDMPEDFIILDR